jgi:hypothetical protein
MDEARFEILIKADGSVKIEAQGFSGSACEQATRALEEAIGKTVSDERTADFYREEKVRVSQ